MQLERSLTVESNSFRGLAAPGLAQLANIWGIACEGNDRQKRLAVLNHKPSDARAG